MKVWLICEEHGERAYKAEVRGVIDLHCWVRDLAMRPPSSEWQGPPPGQTPCRVVEMELHPAGTRVVTTDSEHCDECGQAYDDVYALPDDLWALIHERAPAGLLCPTCALTRLADLIEGGTPIEEGSSIAMLVERGVLEQFDIGGYDSVTP